LNHNVWPLILSDVIELPIPAKHYDQVV